MSQQGTDNEKPPARWHWPDWSALLDKAKTVALNLLVIAAIMVGVPAFVRSITTKGVIISDIAVPQALTDRGLSSDVISRRILDHLHEIVISAESRKAEAAIAGAAPQMQVPDIQLPIGGLNLSGAIAQIRGFLGYSDTKISGEIVTESAGDDKNPPAYSLRLRMAGKGVVYHSAKPSSSIESLVEEAAVEVMHRFDPINLGYYLYRKKDYVNAYRMTETAIANNAPGDDGWAFNMRGLIERDQRHYPQAIAQFREAIRREPKFAIAYHNLSQTLRLTGDLDEAARVAAKAIELAPHDRQGYANLALVLVDQGKTEDALQLMQRAVREEPRNAQSHFDLGLVLHKLDRLDEAVAAFNKSAEIKPDFAEAYNNLSAALHRTGKYEEARAEAQKAADVDPKSPVPWNLLGLYAFDRKDYPHAEVNFRKAVAIDKAFFDGYVNLGLVLAAEKKFAEAATALQKAAQLHPRDIQVLAQWADLLEAQGQHAPALAKLREAIAIAPRQAMLHERLGRLQEAQGDVDGAIQSYRTAIAADGKTAATLNAQIDRLSLMQRERAASR